MKNLLIVYFLLFNFLCFSQSYPSNINDLKKITPPSPNSASLGKYVEWPVSLYTGVPSINIPIYQLKARSMSMPISINYHASGIRVGDIASRVGLGWSLDAGGVITRSVVGLPDETNYGYFAFRNQYPDPGDLSNFVGSANNDLINQVSQGGWDTQPDIFMFNAMGRSFKFFFDGKGNIISQTFNNVKLTADFTNKVFTAILEDGTILNFGGAGYYEITNANLGTVNTYSSTNNFPSTWCLKSIVTSTGEIIKFSYNTQNIYHNSNFSETDYLIGPKNSNPAACQPNSKFDVVTFSNQSVVSLSLATIESDIEKIFFLSDVSARQDNNGDTALAAIKVISKLSNKYIKEYHFNYSYSSAQFSNCSLGQDGGIYATRLKLSAVQELYPNTLRTLNEWDFTYNPMTLPARGSFAQDHWGYFNGAVSNQTLLPSADGFIAPDHKSGIREPNPSYSQAEMLTKIRYPTGGTTSFTYEQNFYSANQEILKDTTITLIYDLDSGYSDNTTSQSATFYVAETQNATLMMNGVYSGGYLLYHHNNCNSMPSAQVTSSNASSQLCTSGSTSQSFTLNPGYHTLTLYRDLVTEPNDPDHSQVVVHVDYKISMGVQAMNKFVGGVRVKSIQYTDSINSSSSINQYYQYTNPYNITPIDTANDYITQISEQLPASTFNGVNGYNCQYNPDGPYYWQSYFVRAANTKSALGSIQGGVIGYGTVTTLRDQNGLVGKTVSNFSSEDDAGLYFSKLFPFPPVTSRDNRRGLLLSKYDYDNNGRLLIKELNNYQFVEKGYITALKVGSSEIFLAPPSHQPGVLIEGIVSSYYDVVAEQVQQTKNIKTTYSTSTSDSLVTTTNNYYDNPALAQITHTEQLNSKGQNIVTVNKFVLDSVIGLSATAQQAKDNMNARNMVANVLETTVSKNGIQTQKGRTNYKLFPSNLILPESIEQQIAGNPVETRVRYNKYDTKGNLVEQQKVNDIKHSYLYDYVNTYPVAEVVNADSASVAYTSFEADGTGNWTIPSTTRSIASGVTGSQSYNLSNGSISMSSLASSNTYIVSYWSSGGSYSVSGSTGVITGRTVNINGVNWIYYQHTVSGASTVTISGSGNIDELRLYPATAQMTTYTYDPLIGMTSQCDLNNRITYYEYDGLGRLNLARNQDRNIIKKYCYNYAGQPTNCDGTVYSNVAASKTLTKSDCSPSYYTAGTATYTVPANKYTSVISQADADQQAQNDIAANAQNYVNANATCTVPPNINVTYTNATSATVYLKLTNTASGQVYNFTLNSNTNTNPAAVAGQIQQGTYNAYMSSSSGAAYSYRVYSYMQTGVTTYSANNLSLCATCASVGINNYP